MDKYEVIIYWSHEDAAFVAEAPRARAKSEQRLSARVVRRLWKPNEPHLSGSFINLLRFTFG